MISRVYQFKRKTSARMQYLTHLTFDTPRGEPGKQASSLMNWIYNLITQNPTRSNLGSFSYFQAAVLGDQFQRRQQQPQPAAQSRDYSYHAGSAENGRPVYYVVEEPDSLHSDRSPYSYEPADTHTSISDQVKNSL